MLSSGIDFLVQTASTAEYSPINYASFMIVISALATEDSQIASMNTANAACAAQNMLLAATEWGLGSCYVVILRLICTGKHCASAADC